MKNSQSSSIIQQIKMYSEVFGYRINLIYVAIVVAFYDVFHILLEYMQRYYLMQAFERHPEYGCLSDFSKPHCTAVSRILWNPKFFRNAPDSSLTLARFFLVDTYSLFFLALYSSHYKILQFFSLGKKIIENLKGGRQKN